MGHQIEIEKDSLPPREGARRLTPHKSEAFRKEIEMMIGPWAYGVVMAKRKGCIFDFVATFAI